MISELTRLLLSTDGADHESPVDSHFFFNLWYFFMVCIETTKLSTGCMVIQY